MAIYTLWVLELLMGGVVLGDIPSQVCINSTHLPNATVMNYRATPQSFDLACLIDTGGYYLYGDTVHVADLAGAGITGNLFSVDRRFRAWRSLLGQSDYSPFRR